MKLPQTLTAVLIGMGMVTMATRAAAQPFDIAGHEGENKPRPEAQSKVEHWEATPTTTPAPVYQRQQPEFSRLSDPVQKLSRGLINLTCGWMEIPLQTGNRLKHSPDKDNGTNFISGLFIGTGKAIQRTVVGAFEILTFPFGGQPVLPTLDYFDRTKSNERLPLE